MADRMGLGAVFARLLDSELGRRAIKHLHLAAKAEKPAERRTHLRTAVRQARRALGRLNGKQ